MGWEICVQRNQKTNIKKKNYSTEAWIVGGKLWLEGTVLICSVILQDFNFRDFHEVGTTLLKFTELYLILSFDWTAWHDYWNPLLHWAKKDVLTNYMMKYRILPCLCPWYKYCQDNVCILIIGIVYILISSFVLPIIYKSLSKSFSIVIE